MMAILCSHNFTNLDFCVNYMYCVSAKCSQYYSSSDSEDEEKVLKDLVDMVGGNPEEYVYLILKAPIATKVVCFSRLLTCLRSLYGKQCGPRSDCSYRSSLFWVHAVCFYTLFVSNVRQLFAAHDFSRQHFQIHFFSWRFKAA